MCEKAFPDATSPRGRSKGLYAATLRPCSHDSLLSEEETAICIAYIQVHTTSTNPHGQAFPCANSWHFPAICPERISAQSLMHLAGRWSVC